MHRISSTKEMHHRFGGTSLVLPWAGRSRKIDRKSTRLNSSHLVISYAVFCLKKKKNWVNNQYVSIAKAHHFFGFTASLDSSRQLTNPLDDQIDNDEPCLIMGAVILRLLADDL